MLGIGVLGLGSVFSGPYIKLIRELAQEHRVELTALYDVNTDKTSAAVAANPGTVAAASADELVESADVDVVLVLTSMNEHGPLALSALDAGKHVLVEKPMATSIETASELLERSRASRGVLMCAPHIVLSPTFRRMYDIVRAGGIGRPVLARARYGWAGPWWGDWFYRPGGGALFDLGVYNLTTLCAFFGPVRRVTALVGTAIPRRVSEGAELDVQADDNAHLLLDFGDNRFGSVTTGFTMQQYRGAAVELYGTAGTLQMLGDDWAPEGFEHWSNARQTWEVHLESDPHWPWTAGLRHLVDCIESDRPTVTRPEHAFHALEVMRAASISSVQARHIEIASGFPAIEFGESVGRAADHNRRRHDPRTS